MAKDIQYYTRNQKDALAYDHVQGKENNLPAIMFLGGFKSDMDGTKATFLQNFCMARGQEFVRFDYSGHGKSEGNFTDGTIGLWTQDALDILDHILKKRKVVLIGSSMGGWIALLLLLKRPERICKVIGIAAAPDFTEDILASMTDENRVMMQKKGCFEVPNEYSDEPYIFTQTLLEDGKAHRLLKSSHPIDVPLILLQGKKDNAVPWHKASQIKACFPGPKTEIILIEDGDHSLSREQDLTLLTDILNRL